MDSVDSSHAGCGGKVRFLISKVDVIKPLSQRGCSLKHFSLLPPKPKGDIGYNSIFIKFENEKVRINCSDK